MSASVSKMGVDRACGPCTECCWALEVHDLPDEEVKPRGPMCRHCDAGCKIHETRPASCENFICFWLGGTFEESARPDRSGVMVYMLQPEERAPEERSVVLVELRVGAINESRGRRIRNYLAAMQAQSPVMVVRIHRLGSDPSGRIPDLYFGPGGQEQQVMSGGPRGGFALWRMSPGTGRRLDQRDL